eukprot:6199960-Amphidinium_carterae.1
MTWNKRARCLERYCIVFCTPMDADKFEHIFGAASHVFAPLHAHPGTVSIYMQQCPAPQVGCRILMYERLESMYGLSLTSMHNRELAASMCLGRS